MRIFNDKVSGILEAVKASGYPMKTEVDGYLVKKDWDRADKLANAPLGNGHDCFLKGIIVQANVTAPQYWWLQFQRYHFADIVSSQSKMHRILEMDIDKQVNGYVMLDSIFNLKRLIKLYKNFDENKEHTVRAVGGIKCEFKNKKELFQTIIANCPMGLELTARIVTNYLQLKTIYHQRKNHKLEEWHIFCDWIKSLPHSYWITGEKGDELKK